MPHPARRQRGAALLLLLLLLGLGAAALLMGAFGRPDPGPRERATLAALAGAREALLGYAARTGRLPRPAASALDGRESAPASCPGSRWGSTAPTAGATCCATAWRRTSPARRCRRRRRWPTSAC